MVDDTDKQIENSELSTTHELHSESADREYIDPNTVRRTIYERIARTIRIEYAPVLISVVIGLIAFVPHLVLTGTRSAQDWSWLTGLIACFISLGVYLATHLYWKLLPQLDFLLTDQGNAFYIQFVQRASRTKNYLLSGVLFGLLAGGTCYLMGIPQVAPDSRWTFLWAVWVAGFTAGFAVWDYWIAMRTIQLVTHARDLRFDYTDPDQCGGTIFIGNFLLVIATYALFIGLQVGAFFLNVPWLKQGNLWVVAIQWSWIALPFVVSIISLSLPAINVNQILTDYKVQHRLQLTEDITKILNRLQEDKALSVESMEQLQAQYNHLTQLRERLFLMSTWPFNLKSTLQYLGVMAGGGVAAWQSAQGFLSTLKTP